MHTEDSVIIKHVHFIYEIKLQTKINLKLSFISGLFVQNDRMFHNLPVQVLGSMQHVVTKDKLACFLDTQPILDLVVYETECTKHHLNLF